VEGYNIHIIYMIINNQLFFSTKNQCCCFLRLIQYYVIGILIFPSKHIVEMDQVKKIQMHFQSNYLIFLFFKTYMCGNLEIYIEWIFIFFIWRNFEKDNNDFFFKSSRHHCWNVGNCKFQLYLVILSSQFFFKIL